MTINSFNPGVRHTPSNLMISVTCCQDNEWDDYWMAPMAKHFKITILRVIRRSPMSTTNWLLLQGYTILLVSTLQFSCKTLCMEYGEFFRNKKTSFNLKEHWVLDMRCLYICKEQLCLLHVMLSNWDTVDVQKTISNFTIIKQSFVVDNLGIIFAFTASRFRGHFRGNRGEISSL